MRLAEGKALAVHALPVKALPAPLVVVVASTVLRFPPGHHLDLRGRGPVPARWRVVRTALDIFMCSTARPPAPPPGSVPAI